MNKIVREHYLVANLPEDLRAEFEDQVTVTVSIQAESESNNQGQDFWSLPREQARPRSREQMLDDLRRIRNGGLERVTPEQAVSHIRELRDEWDDE